MTTIAELFVGLGIKGSEKTLGQITGVDKGLAGVKSTALETKAAVLGAMYALERMFATSGKAGTDLTNFNALMGMSAQTLQQYQYAARQVGISNDEMAGTFKALQSTMTKTLMGEGAPKGLARVAQLTGNINPEDLKRFAEQPQLLVQKLQEYAQKETNTGLRNEVLKSFGIGENMIAAMNRNAFRPDVLSKAPTYSDKEIKSLDKANIAWSNLGTKIEMAFGHFNAEHGNQLVGDISRIVDKVITLAEAFERLAETLKIFKLIGMVFEGWAAIFTGITDAVKGLTTEAEKKEGSGDIVTNALKAFTESTFLTSDLPNLFKELTNEVVGEKPPPKAKIPKEKLAPAPQAKPEEKTPAKKPEEHASTVGKIGRAVADAAGILAGAAVPGVTPAVQQLTAEKKEESPKLRLVVPSAPAAPAAKAVLPTPPASAANTSNQNVHVAVNQNFHQDMNDPKRVGDTTKKAIQDAFRQIPAIGNGA